MADLLARPQEPAPVSYLSSKPIAAPELALHAPPLTLSAVLSPLVASVLKAFPHMPEPTAVNTILTQFVHTDALCLLPVVRGLHETGAWRLLASGSAFRPSILATKCGVGSGYLGSCLRALAVFNVLQREDGDDGPVSLLTDSDECTALLNHLDLAVEAAGRLLLVQQLRDLRAGKASASTASQWTDLAKKAAQGWGIEDTPENATALKFLDALVVGPAFSALFMDDAMQSPESIPGLTDVLLRLGWWSNGSYTDQGNVAAHCVLLYHVPNSYLPTLTHLDKLLKLDDTSMLWEETDAGAETHVDRPLNLAGTSGMYMRLCPSLANVRNSFLDLVITNLFDDTPLEEQPRFVCDMGCGNGMFLADVYKRIVTNTRRGRHLEQFPLLAVCADLSVEALEEAAKTMKGLGIPHATCRGDIGNPAGLRETLWASHKLHMKDGLHFRAFLDHNRPYTREMGEKAAREYSGTPFEHVSQVRGFVDKQGNLVEPSHLQAHLVQYFKRWTQETPRFGFVSVDSNVFSDGVMAGCPGRHRFLDVVHCMSAQYVVELATTMEALHKAGLRIERAALLANVLMLWVCPHKEEEEHEE